MPDHACPRCGDTPTPTPGLLARCGCGRWAVDPDGQRGAVPPPKRRGG